MSGSSVGARRRAERNRDGMTSLTGRRIIRFGKSVEFPCWLRTRAVVLRNNRLRSPSHLMCWRICLSIVALATAVSAQQPNAIHGRVSDSSHSPIANASIEFHSGTDTRLSTTDDNGTFIIPNVANEGTLLVSYPGFTPVTIGVRRDSLGNFLEIYLQPAPIVERILVSPAASDRISAVPNSQFSISKQEIELSGSLTLDDVLREAPGFSLFRRSGSLFANPTSQGVSLRGVGSSGARRATVLLDGVPLNTPFGAWVYWDRVPKLSVERVEVASGAASALYSSGALGGVVNIITKPLRKSFATVEASQGNENTPAVSLDTGVVKDNWGISVALQAIRTNGYILIPRDQRGSVDTSAVTGHLSWALRLSLNVHDTVYS